MGRTQDIKGKYEELLKRHNDLFKRHIHVLDHLGIVLTDKGYLDDTALQRVTQIRLFLVHAAPYLACPNSPCDCHRSRTHKAALGLLSDMRVSAGSQNVINSFADRGRCSG